MGCGISFGVIGSAPVVGWGLGLSGYGHGQRDWPGRAGISFVGYGVGPSCGVGFGAFWVWSRAAGLARLSRD